jgi:hypothetical protein
LAFVSQKMLTSFPLRRRRRWSLEMEFFLGGKSFWKKSFGGGGCVRPKRKSFPIPRSTSHIALPTYDKVLS